MRRFVLARTGKRPLVAWLVLWPLLAGCGDAATGDERVSTGPFTEVAEEVGLDFRHFNGMSGKKYLVEIYGPGVALLDYDRDGDLDVFVVQGHLLGEPAPGSVLFPWEGEAAPRDRLFRNELVELGRLAFRDVTEISGIDSRGYGMGVAAGDFDNDGWVDLYVTELGENRLFRNRGDGSFVDVTDRAGVRDPWWSVSATFLDYDRDGWLDLYVADYLNYSVTTDKDCFGTTGVKDYCGPSAYPPLPDRLFHNDGDGTFTDVTAYARVAREPGAGLGVVTGDFNCDDWIDVYVANDGMENSLWINGQDGTFHNRALLSGCALNADGKAEASMGVDAKDFDGDGDEDLFMAHLRGETNTIYINDGAGGFEDRSVGTGLGPDSQPFTGFGTAWFDFDNDGLLDILVVNGAVTDLLDLLRAGDPFPLHQRNLLYRQLPGGHYEEVIDHGPITQRSEVSRGAAFGDLDNDGDLDVVIGNNAGPLRLLRNDVGNRNHWLGLRMIGRELPRAMVGTWVGVLGEDGNEAWRRVRRDGSYASSSDPRLLFGLGASQRPVRVRAVWPDGSREEWPEVPVDRWVELRKGSGTGVRF